MPKFDIKRDYYAVLGISRDADANAIKRQYRKLIKENHPDKHSDEKEIYEAIAKDLINAHDILVNQYTRAEYDKEREKAGYGTTTSLPKRTPSYAGNRPKQTSQDPQRPGFQSSASTTGFSASEVKPKAWGKENTSANFHFDAGTKSRATAYPAEDFSYRSGPSNRNKNAQAPREEEASRPTKKPSSDNNQSNWRTQTKADHRWTSATGKNLIILLAVFVTLGYLLQVFRRPRHFNKEYSCFKIQEFVLCRHTYDEEYETFLQKLLSLNKDSLNGFNHDIKEAKLRAVNKRMEELSNSCREQEMTQRQLLNEKRIEEAWNANLDDCWLLNGYYYQLKPEYFRNGYLGEMSNQLDRYKRFTFESRNFCEPLEKSP